MIRRTDRLTRKGQKDVTGGRKKSFFNGSIDTFTLILNIVKINLKIIKQLLKLSFCSSAPQRKSSDCTVKLKLKMKKLQ